MSFLLDTNVASEARKPNGNRNVRAWFATVTSTDLHLSVLLLGEVRQGIERLIRRQDLVQAAVYEAWLDQLQRDFADRIISITAEIAEEWGRMNVPDPLPAVDSLMAATAKVHGWTFVTRDTAALLRTGVLLLDPFEPR